MSTNNRRDYGKPAFVLALLSIFLISLKEIQMVGSAVAQQKENARPSVVEARSFVVLDENGRKVAVLGHSEKLEEGVSLKLFDSEGKNRLALMLVPGNNNQPLILLKDEQEETRLAAEAGYQGNPAVLLFNGSGQTNLSLVGSDFATGIEVYDRGRLRGKFGSLTRLDTKKRERVLKNEGGRMPASFQDSSSGSLVLYSKNGEVVTELPH